MTNAEHSFRDRKQGVGVDTEERYGEKFALAIRATKVVIGTFMSRVAVHPCGKEMKALKGVVPLDIEEKKRLLGIDKLDFTIPAFWRYRALADLVETALAENHPESAFFISNRWLPEPRVSSIEHVLVGLAK